jgi:hypothetical protein
VAAGVDNVLKVGLHGKTGDDLMLVIDFDNGLEVPDREIARLGTISLPVEIPGAVSNLRIGDRRPEIVVGIRRDEPFADNSAVSISAYEIAVFRAFG